jgi:hypothetical protein
VADAVNHVRKRWNKNDKLVKKYWKLASYCINKYNDDVIENVINNLYTIDWNLNSNKQRAEDRKDLMIDWTDFWKQTSWHSVDIICKDGQRSVKDSWSIPYYWLKHKLSEISNIGTFFYVYTLVSEDNYEEIKRLNAIKAECNTLIEHLWTLRHLSNEENFKGILHYTAEKLRWKISTCNEMLKKLN